MKKILLIVLSLILIVSLVACKQNDFEAYMKSVSKTAEIKKGQQSIDYKMNIDFDTEGLSPEKIKDLNYFKNFESEFNLTYDDELKKNIARNYFNFGGLGFDAVFYYDGEKSFIKMPIIGKYLVLDEKLFDNYMEDTELANSEKEYISKEAIEKVEQKWLDMITRDDVFAGKDSIMSTPDGEVKVTEYTIKLTGEEFKNVINESADILLNDEVLRETIKEYIEKSTEDKIDLNLDEVIEDFKDGMKYSKIEDISYVAYIDIDGYIVKENIEFEMNFKNSEEHRMNSFKYFLEINRWSIEKEQEFNFPELTEDNTLNTDEVDQGVPFMFENIFEKNE